ncbi:hypothetical protein [Streptomyces alanosinicus]|uniref:Thiaminase-2/PQQC domain-containing protein n=1 Tax=Streptomyces alanosinicus TaxID=68171 RepID=A0A918YGF1_9ACTN|nr:hypothetical protein [Streptomyces alanosinicus]GHE02763.1 hypothetical protein GCM10010339_27220 [Streptomyces alanosinicus]
MGDPGRPPRLRAPGATRRPRLRGLLHHPRDRRGTGGGASGGLRTGLWRDAGPVPRLRPPGRLPGLPRHVSWLALNASPADVVLALTANFSAWGGYCARIATGLRTHYGFGDEACAFFDFFAEPAPDLDAQAASAVQAGLDSGTLDPDSAHTYGTLLQKYESMFWSTLS